MENIENELAVLIIPVLFLPILLFSILGIISGVGFERGRLTPKEKRLYLKIGSTSRKSGAFDAKNGAYYGRETHLLVGTGGVTFYTLVVLQTLLSRGNHDGPISLTGMGIFCICIVAALTRSSVRHLWSPKWARLLISKNNTRK